MALRSAGRHYVITMVQAYRARPVTAFAHHYLGGRARVTARCDGR
jgi:hypothetical protein